MILFLNHKLVLVLVEDEDEVEKVLETKRRKFLRNFKSNSVEVVSRNFQVCHNRSLLEITIF